ncbi:22233_t:CDS:2, partial [Racocetra persica]
PAQWSRLPNPITHRRSFMMSDNLRILMIFPFVLNCCLTLNSIKEDYLKSACDRLHFSQQLEVRDYIIYTWALSAKAAKEVFSLTIQRSTGYSKLQAILNKELEALIKLFPDSFQNLPNLHINRHLVNYAYQYATCINTAVGTKEMVHRIFKAIVPHTNKHNLELTLLRHINTLQTLRYLVDNGIDDRMPNYSTQSIFMPLIAVPRLCNLLSGWCINNYNNSTVIVNPNFFNRSEIKLGQKWNKYQIETAGFVSTNIETNNLLKDIMDAYSLYYSFEQALLETRVCFYENATYTICQSNGDYYDIKLKIGEIVEARLFGEDHSRFGKITGIIEHFWNNGQAFIFLCFNWLENFSQLDSLLDCPIYHIQHNSSNRIHPISVVLQSSNIHFLHYCKASCSFQQHDITNY